MKKYSIVLILLMIKSVSAWSQAYLAYTKSHVEMVDSHFVSINKPVNRGDALYVLPHKKHHGLHLHNGYYWAVHVKTHQEGFVPAHHVRIESEIPFNANGEFNSSVSTDVQNPVVEIKNSSKYPLRIKLGEEEHEVKAHNSLTLHMKKGKYYYRVSVPEIDHYYSVETLDEYKMYVWDFYIHEETLE